MAQGVVPFQYEEEKTGCGMTALAGLPLWVELMAVAGLLGSIARRVRVAGEQGWTDVQAIATLVLLQLAGGTAVEDLQVLETDPGFCTVLRAVEGHGLSRQQRRALGRRWRKARTRTVPSPSAMFR